MPIRAVLVLICLTLILGLLAHWLPPRVASPEASNPSDGLVAESAALDFGEVWESGDFHWTIPFKNGTSHKITIRDFYTSCSCSKVEPKTAIVEPGQLVQFQLLINLRAFNQIEDPTLQKRRFEVAAAPITDSSPPIYRVIHGTVCRTISLSAVAVNYQNDLKAGRIHPRTTIKATANTPLKALNLNYDSKQVDAKVIQCADSNIETYQIELGPNKDLPAGVYEFGIKLLPMAPDGSIFDGPTIALRASVAEQVELLPASLSFRVKAVGSTVSGAVTLQAPRGVNFAVKSARTDSSNMTIVLNQNINSENEVKVQIVQPISETGNQIGKAEFNIVSEGREFTLKLPVTYCGVNQPLANP